MVRNLIRDNAVYRAYGRYRLQREYLNRAERYRVSGSATPSEGQVRQAVKDRLCARGWRPIGRRVGEVHTFAVIPASGWHQSLIDTLGDLGRVSPFTFEGDRFFWRHRRRRTWPKLRAETNREIVQEIRKAHSEHPIDWVFFYTDGLHLLRETVRQIHEEMGLPTTMMCLDDKHSWEGERVGGRWTGQVDLVPEVDVYWTNASACCGWVLAEGGRPIHLPEGCDPTRYRPMPVGQDIPVSFVGSAYGYRKDLIRFLKRWHVPIVTFGEGWESGSRLGGTADMVEIFNRSQINLGHGGIGYSETLTNIKGRSFEVSCTGGGMYLTTFCSDLADHFAIGREIACYLGREELVDRIHHYLQRPDDRQEMARLARERCLREHRWGHRYIRILQLLGVLDAEAAPPPLPA